MLITPLLGVLDDDPIREQLDAARTTYRDRVDKAKAKLLEAIEKRSNEAAAKGDLKGVKSIDAQKEQFELDGTLPTAPTLSAAATSYKSDVRAAADAFTRALKKGTEDYTKAKKIEHAEAIAAELAQFEADQAASRKPKATDPVNKKEPFQEGTVWSGTRFPRDGAPQRWEMKITARERTKVKGQISIRRIDGGVTTYAFQGTTKGPRIEFVTEKLGTFQQHFVGKFNGTDCSFEWDGMSDRGYPTKGTANLAPKNM
jgi:hypothetical protein